MVNKVGAQWGTLRANSSHGNFEQKLYTVHGGMITINFITCI
jgi:hypothetical protein